MDNLNNVPESVTVVFPRGDDRWALHHVETVSGTGHTGTQLIHSSAIAPYVGSLEPVNSEEIAALAAQIAADFYAWRKASVEIRYESVVPWTPDGMHDLEYSHGAGISTAVHRSEWEPDQGELQHAGQFGSRDGPQYVDSPVIQISGVGPINGTYGGVILSRNSVPTWTVTASIYALDLYASTFHEGQKLIGRYTGLEAHGWFYISLKSPNTSSLFDDTSWAPMPDYVSDPTSVQDYEPSIVAEVAIANGALTIVTDSVPTDFATTVDVIITDANSSIAAGTVSIGGTDTYGFPIVELID